MLAPPDGRAPGSGSPAARYGALRLGRPRARPVWWQELALVALVYGSYTLTRNNLPRHRATAVHNGLDLLHFERILGLDVEKTLNALLAKPSFTAIALIANYSYALLHFGVTAAVLGWLYATRPASYRPARTVLVVATLLALLGFWLYPVAPPRMLPSLGYVDTIVRYHTWGSWASPAVRSLSNEFAAMPSVHFAWATWCAVVVIREVHRRWVRVVAALYPVYTCIVIMATANHYLVDAVAGVVSLGIAAAALLSARHACARLSPAPRVTAGSAADGGHDDSASPLRR